MSSASSPAIATWPAANRRCVWWMRLKIFTASGTVPKRMHGRLSCRLVTMICHFSEDRKDAAMNENACFILPDGNAVEAIGLNIDGAGSLIFADDVAALRSRADKFGAAMHAQSKSLDEYAQTIARLNRRVVELEATVNMYVATVVRPLTHERDKLKT